MEVHKDYKVTKEILQQGDGSTFPKKGQRVQVHYVGRLLDKNATFDSSRQRNKPFQFDLGKGEVMKGWDMAVADMSVGEKSILTIPPKLAYGERGHPGVIPPNSTLVFEIELLRIEPPIKK